MSNKKTSKNPAGKKVTKPDPPNPVTTKPSQKTSLSKLFLILPTLIAVIAALFFYQQWIKVRNEPEKEVEAKAQRDMQEVIGAASQLMELPQDETPTLVTIDNKDEISQNQKFFINAENGDKMLIYRGIQKAILYRPSTNRIINVAPINFEDQNPPETMLEDSPAPDLQPTEATDSSQPNQ